MVGTTALVLAGGGARGAYEAGVIRYLRDELPKHVGGHVRLDLLCGTSVGAITACYVAATMDRPQVQSGELEKLWGGLTLEKIYGVENEDLWTLTRKMWRAATNENRTQPWYLPDLLHPKPLEDVVRSQAPWDQIAVNLEKGHFQALSVTATSVSRGTAVVFVQRKGGGIPPWSRDPFVEARAAVIGPEHALASSAIPLMFRSVRIGDEFFCDGSLRQNTPLSPALRLGAERVLIISLKHEPAAPRQVTQREEYPTTPVLMGKILNALMLDHTDYDLDRLRRFNAILETGVEAFGPNFFTKMSEVTRRARGQEYRLVRDLVLRPSRDIGQIASDHTSRISVRSSVQTSLPTKLLHRLAQSQLVNEADLASYLLFDGEYCRELMTLAMEDCHQRREELIRFFTES